MEKPSYRTPLSRARGLGAAHHGAAEWIASGLTAAALVPLTLWMVFAVLRLAQLDYAGAVEWIGRPVNTTLVILTVVLSFAHMHHGMRVVIEDYIHKRLSKLGLIALSVFVSGLAGALTVFSILTVAFRGGVY
ncbi:succinate dehydrogenase, hydrophobic membrane anchor protein [Phenylobacterium sp.]|jgi:succinate dehydrogenase / fumarate reductase membrane anchor subunit|uniref:succinate dehydrogenase, hydrophobic membrane anchor protein n=1 Tax=Phenylobacterium sp. TaxID=1871053 RepID=UPI002F95DBA8